jgi:hypothetical protein
MSLVTIPQNGHREVVAWQFAPRIQGRIPMGEETIF